MSIEEETEVIKNLYKDFVPAVFVKIRMFYESKYDTFIEDVDNSPFFNLEMVQNNLDTIRKYYSFVLLIDEIYKLDFIQMIIKLAQKYDFKPDGFLVNDYASKDLLALDLALHFPLWEQQTYLNFKFRHLFFRREKRTNDNVTNIELGHIPILDITIDDNGDIACIKPVSWDRIHTYFSTVFRK